MLVVRFFKKKHGWSTSIDELVI